MVHGPCGAINPSAPCMEGGICTKKYPKTFQEETVFDGDGYPLYRRRNSGIEHMVRNHMIDNRWIVPYNPFLSAKYNCHINVECAASFLSIKYVNKYMAKGPDRATVAVQQQDEITQYMDTRYISASEAGWRHFHFDLHEQVPNVVRLQIHLEGQHLVTYNPQVDPHELLQRAQSQQTSLTAFFAANANTGELGEYARQFTYQEFPQHFTLHKEGSQCWWGLRKKGFALGRMYFVSPTAGEKFYLRTLLAIVKGPTSFQDLYRVGDMQCQTYYEACLARGLLQDDGEWRQCLEEAAHMQTGSCLRRLFATILLYCNPSQPAQLWNEFRSHICDDLSHRLQSLGISQPSEDEIYDYGLFLVDRLLQDAGHSLRQFNSMPVSEMDWERRPENRFIVEQLDYDRNDERRHADMQATQLNVEQKEAYRQIVESVQEERGTVFFLNGPAGTGKTFVYNTVCHEIRSQGQIVLCVASSGIASILLKGGRTSHSMFKIPIDNLTEASVCGINKQSPFADMLRRVCLIIWDEVPMQHRFGPEAVNRTLQDIRNDDRPFGGITVVFGGDFQQTLPVIPRGSREEIISASLQRSLLWQNICILYLRQNMRLEQEAESSQFAEWLLDIGHGRHLDENGNLHIPEQMCCADENDLIGSIYSGISSGTPPPPQYFLNHVILSARNSDVDDLNNNILDRLSGEERIFFSADSVELEPGADEDTDTSQYTLEFLRSLTTSGVPPGELRLKLGCPLILLRNLAPSQGLCNGTRMILRRMSSRVLEVEIIGGDHNGKIAFIPRITLIPSTTNASFSIRLRRHQFPVRLAFAMSINKAQGQSVKFVGIDLRTAVFTHGQLYVALSRATSKRHVHVLLGEDATDSKTKNIVFPEVLLD